MVRQALVAGVVAGFVVVTSTVLFASGTAKEGMGGDVKTPAAEPTKIDGVYALTSYGQKAFDEHQGALPALETATFGAGCFWGVEARYRALDGVVATAVGYAGGHMDKPTYKDVCGDGTGHAEVVELKFDPAVVTYDKLLELFWNNHNPTQLNRQGVDVGSQYRSAIFYHTEAQKETAAKSKQAVIDRGVWSKPVVTEISQASAFYPAEEYHQQYLEKRGQASCGVPGGH
ncbi:MAG: peptide-methionine (S)-S-oxide reductase MsrA [Phycisphaerales bacterium]|nr:peptide-methionine (S)-S-oxide reductase MsrA [Phycisphaerales bacterium]